VVLLRRIEIRVNERISFGIAVASEALRVFAAPPLQAALLFQVRSAGLAGIGQDRRFEMVSQSKNKMGSIRKPTTSESLPGIVGHPRAQIGELLFRVNRSAALANPSADCASDLCATFFMAVFQPRGSAPQNAS